MHLKQFVVSAIKSLTFKAKLVLSLSALAMMVSLAVPPQQAIADAMGNAGVPPGLEVPDVSDQPATPSNASVTVQQAVTAIASTITEAFEGLVKNEGLKAGGKTITYTLFAIVFAWNLLRTMVQGDGVNGLVAELVPMIGTLAIITALLESGGVGEIIKFMDSVASTFGASGGLGADILAAIKKGMTAVSNILTMPSTNTKVPLSINALGAAIGTAVAFIAAVIAKLIASFLVVIATGLYVANIVLAHGSIMLAVALAPVMVPFMLAPALSFIFDGWLRFLLGAGMIKVVGSFMIGFTDKLMDGLVNLSAKVAVPKDADFTTIMASSMVVYCGLVLMAGLCAYLMMQVPSLATGILSGSAGAGFKGMRAITGGVGFQIAKGASGATASTATSLGRGAVGAIASKSKNSQGLRSEPIKTASQKYGSAGAAAYRALGGKTYSPPPAAPKKD